MKVTSWGRYLAVGVVCAVEICLLPVAAGTHDLGQAANLRAISALFEVPPRMGHRQRQRRGGRAVADRVAPPRARLAVPPAGAGPPPGQGVAVPPFLPPISVDRLDDPPVSLR